jgi:alkylhydroperoxidase family enzyme
MDIGSAVGRTGNIADEKIAAVPVFRESDLFDERERAALEYAEEMTKTPVAVADELFARLRRHFDDEQLVELTASIAYENYRARFYHALNIGSDQLYS